MTRPGNKPWPLRTVWLHWILVNTTGFSSYVSAVSAAGVLARSIAAESDVPVMLLTGFIGIAGVGFAQQLVLYNTKLQNKSWTFLFYLGLVCGSLAGCAGILPATLLAMLAGDELGALLGVGLLLFAVGATVGAIQSSGYTRRYWNHIIWMAASGLGTVAIGCTYILYISSLRGEPCFRDAFWVATISGCAYGAISGGGLVYLAHYSAKYGADY